MIQWIFFDLGSTLIDETDCIEYRVSETLKQTGAPSKEEFYRLMEYFASVNMLPYKDAVKKFGLEKIGLRNWKSFTQNHRRFCNHCMADTS